MRYSDGKTNVNAYGAPSLHFYNARCGVFRRLVCVLCILSMLLPVFGVAAAAADDGLPAEQPELSEQSFALYPNEDDTEKSVTLNGLMPRDAAAEAVDVTDDYAVLADFRPRGKTDTHVEEKNAPVLAAYDITITDGETVYQPDDENPIQVEIVNPVIASGGFTTLWHIMDDGTREQITNLTMEEGKISFLATSFSIYAIVDVPAPGQAELVSSVSALTGDRADDGFCLFYSANSYFTSAINNKNCLVETTDVTAASVWYFEQVGSDYKIYTYVDGVKKYIETLSGNEIRLGDTGDLLEITPGNKSNTFYIKKKNENRWLQHSNGGGGIRYYTDNNNATNSQIKMYFADTLGQEDDYCKLNGKSFGIMNYSGGTMGHAFMADADDNRLDMISYVVRTVTGNETLYVAEDSDITMWTFHSVGGDQYTLTTELNGVTKYLNIGADGVTLVDQAQASVISVSSNNRNQVRLSANGRSLTFRDNGFTTAATNANDTSQWQSLVRLSGMTDEDYITYAADRVGISSVPDGSKVIVYTRIWNEDRKAYDCYAVDHDGTLYPCYARGDQIMWVGSRINTLLWDFIEYHYDDGSPNYYYELYNPYSQKYIAPQIGGGQVLSDHTIGINLPGRREGEYYSDIVAWDDSYYSYASLTNDIANGEVTSGVKSEASTYYFALVETPTPTLTEVDTVDNNLYGITMKMVDFPAQTNNGNGFYGVQSDFLEHHNGSQKGLLSTKLDANGYPTVTANGNSLGDLYAGLAPGGTYNPAATVNHLFIDSILKTSGYFEFDSCQNFATLLDENGNLTNNFTVYKELGTNDTTHKTTLSHGQFFPYNIIYPDVYSTKNPENLYSALAIPGEPATGLLPETDPRKYERLHAVDGTTNYYNGMEMSASFVQTPNGKDAWGHDIIFDFTGDDDFWLYVDGELVIDLGGIHSALEGSVNFATGEVVVEGIRKTLRQVFTENYMGREPNATPEELEEYLGRFFEPGETIFKDYSTHDMRVFYMERGAGASNLHMRFNLSYVTPGHVMLTKEVSGTDDIDFTLVEYPFQIWYKDGNGVERLLSNTPGTINVTYQASTQLVDFMPTYTPPNTTEQFNCVYFLNPSMSAEIHFPSGATEYRIVECGLNHEVYDSVHVNNVEVEGEQIGTSQRYKYDSGWNSIEDCPAMVFDNHVDETNLRTLSFTKKLWNEHGIGEGNELTAEDDPTTFSFRLYLSNGVTDTLTLANMLSYYVRDPDGYLCRWDPATQKFVSIGKRTVGSLTEEEKLLCTFHTSMNGSISKIPADHTVEVPNLPVGVKFRVDERDYEIPLGYSLIGYEREAGSYIAEEDGTLNTGWIRPNESPRMYIHNKRGFGMQINKVWSDSAYVDSHEPLYVAVYVDGELLPGTVRRITHPATSYRYFFDDVLPGKTIADYRIFEVSLEDPVVDAAGTVTGYSSITKIDEGDSAVIGAVLPNASTATDFTYTAHYDVGTPVATSGVTGEENVRIDTVTNTRRGGVKITLYDMDTHEPLANGVFVLSHGDDVIGTFVSDADGKITILYDFERNSDYTLTEIAPPGGYVGLPNPAVFSIANDDSVTVTGNESQWETGYKATDPNDEIVAYIDVFNKPFSLQVLKVDAETGEPLEGAHFELYRSLPGVGGYVKDVLPMPGYGADELVTGPDGVVPKLNSLLPVGEYYLTEAQAPSGYELFDDDFIFTITPQGEVIVNSGQYASFLTETPENSNRYVISVPNESSNAQLTVTKTVRGALCNVRKDFTFTLTVAGAAPEDSYAWTKNGVPQPENLVSGGTFTLHHNETAVIDLPKYVSITISEETERYYSTFTLGEGAAEEVSAKTFVLTEDAVLNVVNTHDGVLSLGVTDRNLLPMLFTALPFAFVLYAYARKKRRLSREEEA